MRLLCFFLLIVGLIGQSVCQDEDPELSTDSKIQDEDELEATTKEKVIFIEPKIPADAYLTEFFSGPQEIGADWKLSEATKDGVESAISKFDGEWKVEVPKTSAIEEDYSLVLKSKARHAAVSTNLKKPVKFDTKQVVVQYEVKFQEGQDCGGAYVKLLSGTEPAKLSAFNDKTPYTIMFGPDKCGMDSKLHFIIRHKNRKSNEFEEKHANKPKSDLEKYFTDRRTHLYTLVLNDDNTFEIYVDQSLVNSGHLLKDMEPPINPPKEIEDPDDKKPEDWDEREKIVDSTAVKPDDWDETEPAEIEDPTAVKPDGWLDDEPKLISDPKAVKPSDWDNEMDGEWEAPKIENPKCKDAPGCGKWTPPKIKNPKYKGKWTAPLIDNPSYKGIWKPRVIPNPNYVEDSSPYQGLTPIAAVGIEIWSMTDEIAFDNFIITSSKKDADAFAAETWQVKNDAERKADPASQSVVDAVRNATSEKPWIWAIVAAVIGIPLILILYFCCRSSPEPQKYHRKKTDEPESDDEEVQEESSPKRNNVNLTEAAAGDRASAPNTPKRTTSPLLNGKKQSESGSDSSSEEGSPKKAVSSASDEEPEKETTRKRKVRKD